MINGLLGRKESKILSVDDIPKIRHWCLMLYGYEWWRSVGLDEFFQQLPLVQEEISKRENLRICTLKSYGVKNPK